MSAVRAAALLLLLLCGAACDTVRYGGSDERPWWRRPGPDLPPVEERIVLPDDGYVASGQGRAVPRQA